MRRLTNGEAEKLLSDFLVAVATADRAGAISDMFTALTGQHIPKEILNRLEVRAPGYGRRVRRSPHADDVAERDRDREEGEQKP